MRNRPGFTLIELMIVIAIIAILAAVLVPNFVRARQMSMLSGCKSNLKNLATALEIYTTENDARYPLLLAPITPNFMRSIPTCPSAGADTYSAVYLSDTNPDAFTVACGGSNHPAMALPADYPAWSSANGLVDRP